MTNGEKKAVLSQYRVIERRINRLMEEKAAWASKARGATSSFSDTPRGGKGGDKIQGAVEKIMEIEEKLDREIDAQVDLRNRIEEAVERLEDGNLRDVMRYRYIDGLKWEQIAAEMHYSHMQVCRFHGRALLEIML